MLANPRQQELRRLVRAGFTLVEMLVAVALVLIMMTMFAEIFSLATSSMSKQKGLAELDQRQRLTSTLLRDDLRQRSFRNLFPYHPDDDPLYILSANRPGNVPFDVRLGYFYISENDPENDADDILQLTVTRTDGTVWYGRSKELIAASGSGAEGNPNQPESDDGAYFGEGFQVGSSPSAEVAYFLRNGILYRRVLLIRQTTVPAGIGSNSDNPSTPGGIPLIQNGNGIYPQSNGVMGTPPFYVYPPTTPTGTYARGYDPNTISNRYPEDFDFSATHIYVPPPAMGPIPPPAPVTILGRLDSLTNAPLATLSLGHPRNRFGFQRATGLPVALVYPVGLPLEYLSSGYVGRFTHGETSHILFAYPGNLGVGADGALATGDDSNPYTRTDFDVLNGVVHKINAPPPHTPLNGSRQGEDMLLTNVQNFDVKVWDPGASMGSDGLPGIAGFDDDDNGVVDNIGELGWPLTHNDDGAFVDIGHTGVGFFSQTANAVGVGNNNPTYGPSGSYSSPQVNRCFDTWHPDLGGIFGYAPFRPATVGADLLPGRATFDDDGDGTVDNNTELGWPNTDDVPISIRAIQIRIRYLDVSSGLVRELSIIEQLNPDAI